MKLASVKRLLALGIGLAAFSVPLRAQTGELGIIDFPTSGSPEAQHHFVRGVLLLHSFEYDAAAAAFRRAQSLDPDFVMAYWGEAMTYNHPMWSRQDRAAARAVLERLGPTPEARLAKAPTARERRYLNAIEILFGEGTKASRDTAYAEAMRRLSESYPNDHEAASFHALAILGTSHGGRDIATYMRAAAIVEEVFQNNPGHPGAAHYMIHSYDDPIHAPLGLRAARAYSEIAPAAAHAQHMSSHIFVAMGMWDDVVAANEVAAAQTDWRSGHYVSWLAYGYIQQGRYGEATKLLGIIRELAEETGSRYFRGYLARMRAAFIIGTRLWDDAVVHLAVDTDGLLAAATVSDFATGFSAIKRGEQRSAEPLLSGIATRNRLMRERVEGGYVSGLRASEIMEQQLRALLQYAGGKVEQAVALMKQASKLEDDMPFEFGPPDVVKPSHELLGEILLELNRPDEALREFRRALLLAPRRVLSLLGSARAAAALGNHAAAVRAYNELREIWHRADPNLPELDEVSRFKADAGSS